MPGILQQLKGIFRRAPAAPAPRARRRNRLTNFFAGFSQDSLSGRSSRGGFAGGRFDRLTEEWNPGTIGPNNAFKMHGRIMRERARDLADNNPLASSAVDAYVSNVVECGILPKPQFPDEGERRRLWTHAWNRWGGLTAHATRECDVTAAQTIYELMALWLREIIVGGGCLVHYVELPRRGRQLPLALELIPEERFADWVDTWGRNPKTANIVKNGIEYDPATGRAVAYHLSPVLTNDLDFDPTIPVRVPAEECEYAFFKYRGRIGQLRGHTLLHAAIVWLWALGYYTDNELFASQAKSAWAYMIGTETGADFDWNLLDSDPESGATDVYGNKIEKLEPGMVWRGAPGDTIEAVGPNVPQGESLPWIMLIQRSISVGTGLSYEEVVRDYSQGNFSSTRASANADRKRFRPMQRFTVSHFGNPTYRRFAAAAARAGLDGFPSPSEFLSALDDWLAVNWSPPGWASVNPREDATADDLRLKNRTMTMKEVVEARGGDLDEHFDQLEQEQAELTARGLAPDPAALETARAGNAAIDAESTEGRN